jgi:uncharacterized BrkB/YihY/UPF0761 family membrane protein
LRGWLAGLAGLDEAWVVFWGWLRFPVALFLLAAVLSVFYRFAPETDDLSGLRCPAPSSP